MWIFLRFQTVIVTLPMVPYIQKNYVSKNAAENIKLYIKQKQGTKILQMKIFH